MNDSHKLDRIIQRLEELEAQNAIRNCMNRYMEICDQLDIDTDLNELMALFDQDSIWEGVGEKYKKSLGYHASWQAIYDMFKTYTQEQSHFVMNAHFVNSEQIELKGDMAHAKWMMLQTSTFRDGRSHLNGAKLNVKFKKQADQSWKIKHFQTENLFSRPVSHWHSEAELPVPQAESSIK